MFDEGEPEQDFRNASQEGYFSISVIIACLQEYGLTAIPGTRPDMVANIQAPENENGFVCHHRDHWFAIRKVHGKWYDLDSLKPAPERLTDPDLRRKIKRVLSDGYSIFVLRDIKTGGRLELPLPRPDGDARYLGPNQFYLDENEMNERREKAKLEQEREEAELNGEAFSGGAAIANKPVVHQWPSQAEGRRLDGGPVPGQSAHVPTAATPAQPINTSDDAELAEAIRLSMEGLPAPPPEPLSGPGCITVMLRLPKGSRKTRRFSKSDTLRDLFTWVEFITSGDEENIPTPLCSLEMYSLLLTVDPKREIVRFAPNVIQIVGDSRPNLSTLTLEDAKFHTQEVINIRT